MERVITHHSNNHCYIRARKAGQNNQLWVYDEHSKTIKSFWEMKDKKNSKRSLDVRGSHVTVQNTDSRWYQLFKYETSGHLHSSKSLGAAHDYYVVVQGNVDAENRAVYRENTRKDDYYQKWKIVYSD